MWCIKCQADVAAEMAPDNRRILCASCGSPIRTVPMLPNEDKTRQARELLERWSKTRWSEETQDDGELLEAAIELPKPKRAEPMPAPRTQTQSAFRVDQSPSNQGSIAMISEAKPKPSEPKPSRQSTAPVLAQRAHHRHEPPAPGPHFPGGPFAEEEEIPARSTSAKLQAFWGQMLAYAGILGLTIGAAFVLLGYFGGPQSQSYAPTGWLITTIGQMLLFLGVVTLVSGGMEQTTEEVARRIDRLGQRILRIEWAAQNHALKGPSIPAEQFRADDEEKERLEERGTAKHAAAVGK